MGNKRGDPVRLHLVIVGGGATGAAVLANILKRKSTFGNVEITIIEPAAELGLGKAYSSKDPANILNVPVGKMTLFEDEPADFVEWVEKNLDHEHTFKYWPFVPRSWFGQYVGTRIRENDPGFYKHCRDRVVSLKRTSRGWEIKTREHGTILSDLVLVATGYTDLPQTHTLRFTPPADQSNSAHGAIPSRRAPQRASSASVNSASSLMEQFEKSLIHPYDSARLENIPSGDRVLIVGAGLTAIDVLRKIGPGRKQTITFLSRHGIFPMAHPKNPPTETLTVPFLPGMRPIQILQVLRAIVNAKAGPALRSKINSVQAHSPAGRPESELVWAALIDQVRGQAQDIWLSWNEREKSQFVRHLKTLWEVGRHRLPPIVAEELAADRMQEKVKIFAGHIVATRLASEGKTECIVEYRPRGQTQTRELRCDWIVLATGHPIDQSLVDRSPPIGFKKAPLGLGYLNNSEKNLWFVGPASRYGLWEVTAMPEIRRQIGHILDDVAQALATMRPCQASGIFALINRPPRYLGYLLSKFRFHPHESGETYWQHFFEAIKITVKITTLASFALVHAALPFFFKETTSGKLRDLAFKVGQRRLKKRH